MKKLIILSLLTLAGQVAAWGQTVDIYMKDGRVIEYDASGVDYVYFTAINHEAVDLGLPSGLKWATCNVGATKPEEAGAYFAWGEVEEKEDYSWSTYKWSKDDTSTITKYANAKDDGSWDGMLEPADDVAHVRWGGSWRMPTQAEAEELVKNCKVKKTTQNDVNGFLFTGPNGNSIFLPTPGVKFEKGMEWEDKHGDYWTSGLNKSSNKSAAYLYTYYESNDWGVRYYSDNRREGYCIRPVTDAGTK